MEPVVIEHGNTFQEIRCSGQDSYFSFPVYGNEVVINASEINTHETNVASNKVKVSQISKFEWEERFYHGNLVSCNSSFVAYIIKSKGEKDDHVRVINHHTSSRVLLRGSKKKVVDLCFESFKSNNLACVDSEGTLYVFEMVEGEGIIKSNLIIQVNRTNIAGEEKQRVIWAPNLLLPMDTHESMIAVSNDTNAEVYDLKKILETHDSGKEYDRDDITVGVMSINDCHTKAITCLALSPDTNVLVTCSLDGDVKFWSVNFRDPKPPSCLHEWEPHDGQPVTSLFFCDNLLVRDDTTPFWRYLMTGTSMSSVLKIWCAVKWECLQTIEFVPYPDQNPISLPSMRVAMDISAKFLIMSDIHRPVLYICHLNQDVEKEKISVISISEFVLKEPLLSFSIFVAKDRKSHFTADENNGNIVNGIDGDGDNGIEEAGDGAEKNIVTAVTLFAIQKSAIQKLSIKFCANSSVALSLPSVSTADSSLEDLMSIRDALSDVEISETFSDKLQSQQSGGVNESIVSAAEVIKSIDSSITAVSTVTHNGNHTKLSPVDNGALTLIEINETSASCNSLVTSVTDSVFSDTFATANKIYPNKLIDSISEPQLNGITSLSLDSNQTISYNNITSLSIESDQTIPEEKVPPTNVHSDALPSLPITKSILNGETSTHTMDQLLKLLHSQQQILNNQQQVLNNQQQELKEIKDMMNQLLNKQHDTVSNNVDCTENERDDLKVYMQLLQKSATSQFNKANKEFNKLCMQRLDQFTSNLNTVAQQKEEHNIQVLSNILSNTIAIKLEKTVKQEMKQTVLTSLDKLHTKYMENVNNQIAQKLSVWERTLREETQELIKSKPLAESIGLAAAGVLQGTIPNAYSECFQRIVLPGFEKALMAVFMQIDQTFRHGTKQHLENVTKQLDARRHKQQDIQDPLILHLQELIQSFQATADRLTSGVETNLEALMQKQLCDALEGMQNNFSKTIETRIVPSLSASISHSLSEAMEDFKRKIVMFEGSSFQEASNEKSEKDRKARIMSYVEQRNYNKAFEEALTAADLTMVMFLCKQVEPNLLFTDGNSPFTQPIILSLIQQLSVNLIQDTEMKRRYLEESIMALDKDDEITREHLPTVLQGLNDQLNQAIESLIRSDSTSVELKPLKMLLMASKSLLHGA